MKRIIFILIQIIISFFMLYSIELKINFEKKLIETDLVLSTGGSLYLPDKETFLIVTIPDSMLLCPGRVEYKRIFYSFDRDRKELKMVDVPIGHSKDCVTVPSYSIYDGTAIYYDDGGNGRITAMLYENNQLKHLYSIDALKINSVPAFNIIDGKLYSSKSRAGLLQSKGLSVYNIINDVQYQDSRTLANAKHYIDYNVYRKFLYPALIEKIKRLSQDDLIVESFFESMKTENVYFKNFALKHNEDILVVNSYATDINRILEDREEFVDSIKIGLNFRMDELDNIRKYKFKPEKFDVFSQMQRVFSDESRDFIMLYIQQMEKLRKASGNDCDYILIKKLGVTEGESEWMIPIDFIPVYYNEEESTFYGFCKVDGFLNYVEYKLEV